MDLDEVKELMSAMGEFGMKRMIVKEKGGFELELEKSSAALVPSLHSSAQIQSFPHQKEIDRGVDTEELEEGFVVTSPMVGTFYASPSPDEGPFVKVGDRVDEETVLCVIEAMKVMNEVKAGRSGIVAQIFVDHANPVEFGTKLFRIV